MSESSHVLEQNALATAGEATPVAAAPAQASAVAASPLRPAPATVAELKTACPGASADFIVAQIEAGATVATAQTAFVAEQNRRIAELQQQVAAKPATVAAAPKPAPGVKPTPASNGKVAADLSGDPIVAWDAAVADLMDERKLTKAQATRQTVLENKELHAAYIAAYTQANAAKVAR